MYYVWKYWQRSQKTKGVLYFFAPMLWPVKGGQTRFTNTSQVLLLMIDHWLFLFAALYYMIQHFRSRRAMTGQRMSSWMERWGVKSFFAKQFFADLWTMICFCVFYRWRASGEFVSLRFFWNEVYKSLYVHTWIHLLLQTLHQNMLRVCTAYLSNRVWNVLKWSWALCCHYPKGSVPVFPYQSVKQSAWALGSPKQTHLICSWY